MHEMVNESGSVLKLGRLGKCVGLQVMIINWKHESSVFPIYAGF